MQRNNWQGTAYQTDRNKIQDRITPKAVYKNYGYDTKKYPKLQGQF